MQGSFTYSSKDINKKGGQAEDASSARDYGIYNIIIVADGVTRDPLPVLPDKTTNEGRKAWIDNYPNPSPAAKASRIAIREALSFLTSAHARDGNFYENSPQYALQSANNEIGAYNRKNFPSPDYLVNDEAACQVALAAIEGRRAYYAALSSSGVAIIDFKGRVKFKTKDTYWSTDAQRHEFLQKAGLQLFKKGHGIWKEPETRFILRSFFRNWQRRGGYGVLTGDMVAMSFVEYGTRSLNSDDVVIAYTDGVAELIFAQPHLSKTSLKKDVKQFFTERDFSGLEDFCKQHIKSEGTLAYYVQE